MNATDADALPGLEVKVRLFQQLQGKRELLGFAELAIAGSFVIKDICIIRSRADDKEGEPFVSYPSKKGTGANEGKYFNVAHPITSEARHRAEEAILQAYREAQAAAQ